VTGPEAACVDSELFRFRGDAEGIGHGFEAVRRQQQTEFTVFHPGGGEFANVASNWLMWTFKGDKKAGKMFTGKDCSLCTNSNWDVRLKGIK